MTPEFSADIEQAVEQPHGCLQIQGHKSAYIVLSVETFRDMMGVGAGEELQASLAAIRKGLADVNAGRTRPVDTFFRGFDARHGIHR